MAERWASDACTHLSFPRVCIVHTCILRHVRLVIDEGRLSAPAIWPFHRVNSKRGNDDVAGAQSRRWNGAKRHIAGAIIYLRNVFIEYYAAQVGNLVHGYAINERRSERDTGEGEDERGNGLK